MRDWKHVKLKEVVDHFIVPMRDKPKVFDGDIPWCRIEDFNGIYLAKSKSNQNVSEETIKSMNLKVYPIGTVLVSCSADLGRCAITRASLVTNQTFIGLYPSELVNNLFLYYTMNASAPKLNSLSSGTTIAYLSRKQFEEFSICIPPLPEQQKIASILSTVDDKIEVIDQQISETQQLKKGLMQRLLTKGIGHTKFKDSALGEIPDSWEENTCNRIGVEFIDGDRGSNYPKSDELLEEGYCLFLSAKNVTKNGFSFEECQFITEEKDNLLRKGKLISNDIVITTRGSVGHIAYYDSNIRYKNVRLNSGMVIMRDSGSTFNKLFLYQLLKSPIFQNQIEFITSGSAQPQLTITGLKKIKLPLLPLEEQQKIASILSTVDEKLEVLADKKSHYQELKKGLMQQLLTGKVRVKV